MTSAYDVNHKEIDLPSAQACIIALHQHETLFERIEDNPQIGIYQTDLKLWASYIPYLESRIHRCQRAVELFVREHGRGDKGPHNNDKVLRREHNKLMNDLGRALSQKFSAVEAASKLAKYRTPSKRSMDEFRVLSHCAIPLARAANGGPSSIYGKEKDKIPSDVLALIDENFDPMARFVEEWLLDPVLYSIKQLWHRMRDLPSNAKKGGQTKVDTSRVEGGAIRALAGALTCLLACGSLIAPIATLNKLKSQNARFIAAVLFGLVFFTFAQFLGPRSIPQYTLITGYFQTMIIYIAIAGTQNFGT